MTHDKEDKNSQFTPLTASLALEDDKRILPLSDSFYFNELATVNPVSEGF